MKAIQVSQTGGPEVLVPTDLPAPKPKADEALVQIKAAGVNFIDVYFREGRYSAQLPFIDGQEGAGVVTEIGSDVTLVQPGDRVAYTGRLGSYAEYAAVPAERLVKIPDELSFEQAAAAMLQGMTAHYLTHSTYKLQAGETALIHAAAGGVGLLLVQMAKKIGARVIGTVSTDEKAELRGSTMRDGFAFLGVAIAAERQPRQRLCPERDQEPVGRPGQMILDEADHRALVIRQVGRPGKRLRHECASPVTLRGIEDLKQCGGWVAMKTSAELIDFIQHEDGVSPAGLSDSLNNIARERTDIGTPMPSNIRLIMDPAQTLAHELTIHCPSDALPEGGLSHARGTD